MNFGQNFRKNVPISKVSISIKKIHENPIEKCGNSQLKFLESVKYFNKIQSEYSGYNLIGFKKNRLNGLKFEKTKSFIKLHKTVLSPDLKYTNCLT